MSLDLDTPLSLDTALLGYYIYVYIPLFHDFLFDTSSLLLHLVNENNSCSLHKDKPFDDTSKQSATMDPQASHMPMLKFTTFKRKLHALLDKTLDEARIMQKTAADPVPLSRSWILENFKEQITQDQYVLEPKAMQVALGLGNLQKLPRELRDLIYGYAIANGTTALVRASKQTKEEASKLIFQKGIYRLSLGFNEDDKNPRLSRTLAKKIQNLKVRVNSRGLFIRGLEQHLPKLRKFDGLATERQGCVVMIECDPFESNMEAYQVLHEMKNLTGFAWVVLELDLQWYGEPWPDTVAEFENERIRARINGALNYQIRILEPALGTARVLVDKQRYRLAFHPRK